MWWINLLIILSALAVMAILFWLLTENYDD